MALLVIISVIEPTSRPSDGRTPQVGSLTVIWATSVSAVPTATRNTPGTPARRAAWRRFMACSMEPPSSQGVRDWMARPMNSSSSGAQMPSSRGSFRYARQACRWSTSS